MLPAALNKPQIESEAALPGPMTTPDYISHLTAGILDSDWRAYGRSSRSRAVASMLTFDHRHACRQRPKTPRPAKRNLQACNESY
jgi:hypothetical protein